MVTPNGSEGTSFRTIFRKGLGWGELMLHASPPSSLLPSLPLFLLLSCFPPSKKKIISLKETSKAALEDFFFKLVKSQLAAGKSCKKMSKNPTANNNPSLLCDSTKDFHTPNLS